MSQKPILDMLYLQRGFQQWIVPQVDHAEHQVIAGSPISMGLAQLLGVQRRT
jgi:hypothetical protein